MLKAEDDSPGARRLALQVTIAVLMLIYSTATIWTRGGPVTGSVAERLAIDGLWSGASDQSALPDWIRDYVRFHNAADTNSTQYLVWACTAAQACGGIGDRVRGIVGSFYLALATRRKLLLDNPDPVPLAQVLRPADLDWRRGAPGPVDLDVDSIDKPHSDLFRIATDDAVRDLKTIRLRTNALMLWLTVMNDPVFADALGALHVPHGNWSETDSEMLFTWAWSVLMRPSNALLHDIDALRRQTGLGSAPFNLVHIRTGSHWSDGGRHGSEDDLRRFAACLDNVTDVTGVGHPVYVASDDIATKERFAEIRPQDRVVYDAASEPFHVDRSGKGDHDAAQRSLRAWSEFYLVTLALCPVVSRSGYSMWPVVMSRDPASGRRCFARFDHCEAERVARSARTLVSVRGLDP